MASCGWAVSGLDVVELYDPFSLGLRLSSVVAQADFFATYEVSSAILGRGVVVS